MEGHRIQHTAESLALVEPEEKQGTRSSEGEQGEDKADPTVDPLVDIRIDIHVEELRSTIRGRRVTSSFL